jgi:hypothetical protein
VRAPLLIAFLVMNASSIVSAQETRAGAIADEQARKAQTLAPRDPPFAEKLVLAAHKMMVLQPAGLYPYFDSVYSGGGFTLGAGYRHFTGDRTHWNVAGLYSASSYKLIDAGVASRGHLGGRLDLRASVGWRDATQVSYHGLGIDSPADGAAFRMQQSYGGGDVTLRATRWLLLTAGAAYEGYTIKDPTGDLISVESTFGPEAAPGVGVNPSYLHTTIAAAVDSRPGADYARRGSLLQVTRHHYADRDDTYTFTRLDTEAVQHIPILRENWVISLRGRLESTLGDDDQVPYFLLPSLGSGSTLRGYSSWRFRDRHAVLASGEWRWIINRLALDMAVFVDTGMVAPRLDAITTSAFVTDYGLGVRFHGPARTPLRVEIANGREGTRIVFAASAAF